MRTHGLLMAIILKKDPGWQRLILIQCHVEVHLSIISKYVILNHIDWGFICLIYFIAFSTCLYKILFRIFELLPSLQVKKCCCFFNENSWWPNHAKLIMTSNERFWSPLSIGKVKTHNWFEADGLEPRPTRVFIFVQTHHDIVFQV